MSASTPSLTSPVSIVIPVLNEAGNIAPLVRRLRDVAGSSLTEVIFVDDSPNLDTIGAIESAIAQYSSASFTICAIHRTAAERADGLSGAVTRGICHAKHELVVVMDGDLQHPPELIPELVNKAATNDVVVASRYLAGGTTAGLDSLWRQAVSLGSVRLAKYLFPIKLRRVSDPMTGFFLVRRASITPSLLRPSGFKILLEILATHPPFRVAEVPLQFGSRVTGTSNGTLKQGSIFLAQLLRLRLRLPRRLQPAEGITTTPTVLLVSLALIIAIFSPSWDYNLFFPAAIAIFSIILLLHSSLEVWRSAYSYRMPETADTLKFPTPQTPTEHFCLLVPARHEAAVLTETLLQLARQTHPSVTIITVICDDDRTTLAAAHQAAGANQRIHVITYPLAPGVKPNKPSQLNYAFQQIRDRDFTVIGVIDAEDNVAPDLLRHVDTAFRDKTVGIVQGGVQLMNHDSSWYSLHNVLEYYRWYSSSMAFQAANQFMPLGGNTVFIRAELLEQAGGWPETLTEDCSLGILLSTRLKAKTAVYYEPGLATREETPDSLKSLFHQRVRWHQGFFHEWRRSVWRELPGFKQQFMALYILLTPMLLAFFGLCLPIALVSILFLKSPMILALLMYLPFIPIILIMVLNAVFLRDFGQAYDRKIRLRHYIILFATFPLYQLVLNAASLWSIIRELQGNSSWYKTPHTGQHRQAVAFPATGRSNA